MARKKKMKGPVRGNPIAKDLRTPKYHKRVVKSKKVYNRKRPLKVEESGTEGGPMFGKNI